MTKRERLESFMSFLEHPVFESADVDPDSIIFNVKCLSCGAVHKIDYFNDGDLDPCCQNRKFNTTE
jgi:hypothetical protein